MAVGTIATPKARTLDALALIAARYGVGADLDRLKQANSWGAESLAMVAEALAAVVVELEVKERGQPRKGR